MRIFFLKYLLYRILAFLILSFSFHSLFSQNDTLESERINCYDVLSYNLDLEIDIEKKYIHGFNLIEYSAKQNFEMIQFDLYENLKIDSILFQNKKIKFRRDSNIVIVEFPSLQKKSSKNSIMVYYQGNPHVARHAPWEGGFIWEKDSLGFPWAGVACQGEGGRIWYPCKNMFHDKAQTATMSFTVPSDLICVSNGNLINEESMGKKKKYTWAVSCPINHYNITLNIGNYSHFSSEYKRRGGSSLDLDYYVLSYHLEKAKKHFEQVPKILEAFEYFFGPYPFEKDGYALVETPYWGMEHQSCIAYGNNYENDLIDFDFIIVHETAHEWWGNSVTAFYPPDIWIHESFATYAESLLLEYYYGKEKSLLYLDGQKKNIKNEYPILYKGDELVLDNTDIYYRGAWMLHSIRNTIGNDSLWFEIIFDACKKYKYKNVSSLEFMYYVIGKTDKRNVYKIEENSGIWEIFMIYLKSTDVPVFTYYTEKDILYYKWEISHSEFKMPILIQLRKNKILKLFPASDFQNIRLKKTDLKKMRVRDDLFYIKIKNLSDKK